jgi:formate C-acetyltransferase
VATATGAPSERASRLKERLLSSPYEIDIERARYYTAAWKRAEKEGPCMRAALALGETLREMSVGIDEDELLVGAKTAKRLAGVIPVERGDFNTVLEFELDRLISRESHRFLIEEGDRAELERDILPWWRGRTVRGRKAELWKDAGIYEPMRLGPASLYRVVRGAGAANTAKVLYLTIGRSIRAIPKLLKMQRELAALRPNLALTVFDVQGHFVPGFRRVLELGFNGIAERAGREIERLGATGSEDGDRADFYGSVLFAARAACEYAERYADLAEKKAARATGPRKAELLDIAGRCRRVPGEPPRTFMEALQSIWMTHVVLGISYGMAGVLSPGRVDQYLFPYYRADLHWGRITREQALEAIEEYLVKLGTELIMLIETGKETASEMGVGSNTLTIGGVDREGNCAVNDVSYLFLEAHDNVRALANNLSVRVSRDTPDDFLERACSSYRYTSGVALFNDGLITDELENDGFALADARDYSIVGCVEPTSTGNCFACTAGNDISLAGVLEMALNEGHMLFAGKRIGVATPDPRGFHCFEDVKDSFAGQLAFNVERLVEAVELLDRAYAESFPSPLLSATLEGCLESGTDLTRGGAEYDYGSITGRGLGTVVNSLAAIRWAVFEQGLLTMDELLSAVRTNFRGAEKTRQMLLRRAPKYGNDDGAADELAAWVTRVFCEEVRKYGCGRGGFYRPGMFSYGVHVVDGLYLGATPDGRLAGEPVSNGISPVNGTERNGPTAVLRSAVAAGSHLMSNGSSLNMRLSPGLFDSGEKAGKLASLVRGYFALGGRHVQFNVVDTATLEDAQAHPEKYPDLVVRVSGYCAYFTDLGRSIQDDIIARTEFCEL